MNRSPVRVIKLGGSLLDWPELMAELWRWLRAQRPAANVIVVGGGEVVEALRQLDHVRPLPLSAAHWLAIKAMSLNASVVAQWWPEAMFAKTVESLKLNDENRPQILDVEHFLRADEASGDCLPAGWHVTSDSIAARLANVLRADELVLLKSTLPLNENYVDGFFWQAVGTVPVRCVNLRDAAFPQSSLRPWLEPTST